MLLLKDYSTGGREYFLAFSCKFFCFVSREYSMNSEFGIAEFIDVVSYEFPIDGKHLIVLNDCHSSSLNNLP